MDLKVLVVICTTIIICLGIITLGIVAFVAFKQTQKGSAASFGLMFQRASFLRISTVLMIVIAIIYLSTIGVFVEQSGVIGILSGIAGYVLGGLEKDTNKNKDIDSKEQ